LRPSPRQPGDDHPGEHRARRCADAGQSSPQGHHALSSHRFGKHRAEQGHGRRSGQRRFGTGDEPRRDQDIQPRRATGKGRADPEHRDTDDEHSPVTEQIGQMAAQHEQPAERQAVRGGDKREVRVADPHGRPDHRKGDGDERDRRDQADLDGGQQRESGIGSGDPTFPDADDVTWAGPAEAVISVGSSANLDRLFQ
jgi:hypothetical protein